ncbi:MAG: EAL domain-containing protein [Clostridia bacterium]|nr:EAL domain-containing protein [Clostridia bacterium]
MVTEIKQKLQSGEAVERNTVFSALPDGVRAYSLRIGYNAWILYKKALEKKLYHADAGLKMKNAPLVYDAVRFFDIGYITEDMEIDKAGKHAVVGAEIISHGDHTKTKDLSAAEKVIRGMARDAALSHHEKWNGSGMPGRLSGEDIPIIARICRICNVFDVHTSGRNNVPALSKADAFERMQEKVGTNFDPLLYDAFLECVDELVVEGDSFPTIEQFNETQSKHDKVIANTTEAYKKLNESVRPIEVWYYPVSDIDAHNASYYESNFCINDRYYGVINTELLLTVAESTGKICDITDIVMDQVFEMLVVGKTRYFDTKRVSIRVPEKYFKKRNLITKLKKLSDAYHVSLKSLIIEVKESAVAAADEAFIDTLGKLRELGIKIAIYGFGMEYSALSRIDKVPFDILKIDKSFVRQLDDSQRVKGLVKGIIEMAKTLRAEVVAENVETEQQRAILRTLECDKICGSLIGQPITLSEIIG